MRFVLSLAGNAVFGLLAGYGIADAATLYGFGPPLCTCAGLIGGCVAGLASSL